MQIAALSPTVIRPTFASPPPAAPSAPADSVEINAVGRFLVKTGNGLAKMGGTGGMLLGGALGLGLALATGTTSLIYPLMGAGMLGLEGWSAREAQRVLDKGVSSPEFQQRAKRGSELSPAGSASHLMTAITGVGGIALGWAVAGGPAGLVVGAPIALAGAMFWGYQAGKAERVIFRQHP